MPDHSGITVFGIAEEGQKNGIPIAGAPDPRPRLITACAALLAPVPPRVKGSGTVFPWLSCTPHSPLFAMTMRSFASGERTLVNEAGFVDGEETKACKLR